MTEGNQLEMIRSMAPLGVEAYWLDAGWFIGGWPSGVGNWSPRADAFPRGLDAQGAYDVTFAEGYEGGAKKRMTGAELAKLRVTLDQAPLSVLVRYLKVAKDR